MSRQYNIESAEKELEIAKEKYKEDFNEPYVEQDNPYPRDIEGNLARKLQHHSKLSFNEQILFSTWTTIKQIHEKLMHSDDAPAPSVSE